VSVLHAAFASQQVLSSQAPVHVSDDAVAFAT
jgi:hypothetical protein